MCRLNNLILIGFKSAGKTTLGRKAAEKFNKPFIDTDDLFEEAPSIFHQKFGDEVFRKREKELLEGLKSFSNHVIATGGGTPLDPDNQSLLRSLGTVVHLHTPKEIVRARIMSGPSSFLNGLDFDAVYDSRLGIYESVAHYSVSSENQLTKLLNSNYLHH